MKLLESLKRVRDNLEWLGAGWRDAWVCPRCRWWNLRADEMCLLCPATKKEATK